MGCGGVRAMGRRAGLLPTPPGPYTAARRLPGGTSDPSFAAKPQIAADLAGNARRQRWASSRWWPPGSTALPRPPC
jgi:hypothetical protein